MVWTFCTSGSAVSKAGIHCSSISGSVAIMANWSDEAEGYINAVTNTDWLTTYAALPASIQHCLSDICSSKIGMNIIAYDNTGYLSREADMLMNMNDDIINKGLSKLDGKSKVLKTP